MAEHSAVVFGRLLNVMMDRDYSIDTLKETSKIFQAVPGDRQEVVTTLSETLMSLLRKKNISEEEFLKITQR